MTAHRWFEEADGRRDDGADGATRGASRDGRSRVALLREGRDRRFPPGRDGGASSPPRRMPGALPGEEDPDRTARLDPLEGGIDRLREAAIRAAREDAAAGVPEKDSTGTCESERELRKRCKAFFARWRSLERRRLTDRIADAEQRISRAVGTTALELDRFERLTNDLCRLKARVAVRRREVTESLEREERKTRGISTRVYLLAIAFLGVVEFFANAPVFGSLLPRDPLTERQIRIIGETSDGWIAGIQRVLAQFLLRPDAALLAAGVVTFLCVLAHFFGHSLRDLAMGRGDRSTSETVTGRSRTETLIPMVISGLGLVLVVGVLYQARVTLGDVGATRFEQDMAVVEELRRNAGWLRVDGDLLAANEASNRADDMEAAAAELREYAESMSRLSFPILLLNVTLVLCAISAAYFHRRDRRREHFNEEPYEGERSRLIQAAETAAAEVAERLAALVGAVRELKALMAERPLDEWKGVVHQLEAVIGLYRAENGRARDLDSKTLPAFSRRVRLRLSVDEADLEPIRPVRDPDEYDRDRRALEERFESIRQRFTEEAIA